MKLETFGKNGKLKKNVKKCIAYILFYLNKKSYYYTLILLI